MTEKIPARTSLYLKMLDLLPYILLLSYRLCERVCVPESLV